VKCFKESFKPKKPKKLLVGGGIHQESRKREDKKKINKKETGKKTLPENPRLILRK